MKRSYLLLSFAIVGLCFSCLHADIEDTYKKSLPVAFSGFVKHESYWDTRQVVGSEEDEVLQFPEPKKLDPNCCDINAKGQFDMVDILTRLIANFDGPQIKHAKMDGIIEVDFAGRKDITNILRMRLAYLTLTWQKALFLAGQEYMPFFVQSCYPNTVSQNTGRPIEPYARYPQINVTYKPSDHFHCMFAAMSQLEFESDGPIGPSSTYLRNAIVPMLQLRLDGFIGDHQLGLGAGFKRIAPRLETNTGNKAREFISSGECMAYTALNFEYITINTQLTFAQNARNLSLIGGYAVHCIDPINDHREYTNLNSISWWIDSDIVKWENVIPGLFAGVVKNLGARETILLNTTDSQGVITDQRVFGRGTNIDTVFRVSPRIRWIINKFEMDAELEYTRAAYGTLNECGNVVDTNPVGNTRLLVALYYYF